jgi:hypothetical protein
MTDAAYASPPLMTGSKGGHTARCISEVTDECLDLSGIYDSYGEASGSPPNVPAMILKLLLLCLLERSYLFSGDGKEMCR